MTQRNLTQKRFVAGTSRGPRRAATLLAQVADLQRGERIKELREQRHLTQPVIAARVDVTLRAYQEWEAGGGMRWENAKRLARVLGATPDYIMSGERGATPDLSHEPTQLDQVQLELAAMSLRLERIEKNQQKLIANQRTILKAVDLSTLTTAFTQAIRASEQAPSQPDAGKSGQGHPPGAAADAA
jgi:transcriptional regulator with XRE-family HTH domain